MKLLFSAEIITETVGYLAAVFGTYLMIPQVYKSYMTKKVNDISKVMVVADGDDTVAFKLNEAPVQITVELGLVITGA